MTVPPDVLKAFIEGKLAQQEASGVAAQIANDPDLAAYVEDQKAFQAALASPQLAWLRRVGESAARRSASWIPAMAMAAGILLGVLLAASFGIGTDMRSDGGALIAQGELAHMLNTALISDQQDARSNRARVGASFWSKNGVFCRSFTTQRRAESALAGLACRDRGAWRIAALAAMESVESAGAQQASDRLPASVRTVMENLIVGEPLKEDAERQARSQGWRPQ
jgi:hypothetical protein